MKKVISMKEVIVILTVLNIVLDCINICMLINLSKSLIDAQDKQEETFTFPELKDTKYFKLHNLSNINMSEIFAKEENDYLVYFFSSTCTACKQTNEYISAFIYYEQTNYIDIYFVDVSQNKDLVADQEVTIISPDSYKVAYTPTLLAFTDGIASEFVGPEKIFEVLNSYAKQAE